jgi:hypothetical protein
MSIQITTWLRAYFALQQAASDSRGVIELQLDDDEVTRWPRTLGVEVISIAAAIDPIVRKQPLRFGGHGLARRWRAAMDDIERNALVSPYATFSENRSFWATLAAMCVYLHSQGAPLPSPEVFAGLMVHLNDPVERRNVGPRGDGPFKHFDGVKTFDDLFNAQLKYLRELRGADETMPEPGMVGGKRQTPRTTNADVIALTDYWTKQLASVKRVFGAAEVEQRWKAARADVDAVARPGDPNAVYPKNNGFWRDLQHTAIHVAVADEAPSKSDMMIDAVKESIVNLPQNIKAGASAIASGAADVAGAVGRVAGEAGKGLFGGFGAPLLIGAGLVGLFLISRNQHNAEG